MNCTATVRRVGEVTVVDLNGRFTIADAPGLIRGTVVGALESGTRNILLNLAQVTYLDSAAGIGELVGSYTSAVRQGACLKLVHADKNIAHVLHLTRLDDVFEMFDDEEAAIHSFRAGRSVTGKE
jgi:anti-sigma B factor antagonist